MPETKHTTSIRFQDLELLRNLAAIEGRDMTEILHRALITYTADVAELTAPGTPNNIAQVLRGTPQTQPNQPTRPPPLSAWAPNSQDQRMKLPPDSRPSRKRGGRWGVGKRKWAG